jgi:hypothetical protein
MTVDQRGLAGLHGRRQPAAHRVPTGPELLSEGGAWTKQESAQDWQKASSYRRASGGGGLAADRPCHGTANS